MAILNGLFVSFFGERARSTTHLNGRWEWILWSKTIGHGNDDHLHLAAELGAKKVHSGVVRTQDTEPTAMEIHHHWWYFILVTPGCGISERLVDSDGDLESLNLGRGHGHIPGNDFE